MPRLRADLKLVTRQGRGEPLRRFLADRSESGKLFELGEKEHYLCNLLDGETPVAEAFSLYEERFAERLEPEDLEGFLSQLEGEGFLEGRAARKLTVPEAFAAGDFLPYGRIRLGRGDRLVGWLAGRLGWLFGMPGRAVATGVFLLGLNTLLREWPIFWRAIDYHWGLIFVVTLVLGTALVVHAPRNLLQAVACKRGGGYVSEMGITFPYYLVPGFYCEYTDVGWLDDKKRLMRTIAAGIWYQLFIWGAAMIGWFGCAQGSLARSLWLALACGSGAGLLLIVANPLTGADGYKLLSTWLEIPQLRERSLAALGAWIWRRRPPEPLTRRERKWFIIFGAAVFVFTIGWLVLILALTGQGLMSAFEGAGALLTLGFAVLFFSKPAGRMMSGMESINKVRARTGAMARGSGWRFYALIGAAIILFLPYPYETGGPFTLLAGLESEIHCEIDGGRIAEVNVREGDFVKAGQALGQIDRREYEKNLEFTRASLEETEARLDYLRKELAMLQNPPDIESILALEAEQRRLKTLVADYERELELTTLLSPIDGRVVTPDIQNNVGRYLRKGDLFAIVEQAETVRVEIQVPEADAPQVDLGARVKVVAWAFPNETHYGKVEEIAPIASADVEVTDLTPENAVRVIAALPNPDLRFKTSTTGFAKIKTEWIPVWYVISRLIVRWFQVQVWYWIP
jgi:putative peptide zinc metalloprotease protein